MPKGQPRSNPTVVEHQSATKRGREVEAGPHGHTDLSSTRPIASPRYRGNIVGMADKWKTLIVRLTPAQYEKLLRLSVDKDRSMSATVRQLVERAT